MNHPRYNAKESKEDVYPEMKTYSYLEKSAYWRKNDSKYYLDDCHNTPFII
jgi:hypothetical protein